MELFNWHITSETANRLKYSEDWKEWDDSGNTKLTSPAKNFAPSPLGFQGIHGGWTRMQWFTREFDMNYLPWTKIFPYFWECRRAEAPIQSCSLSLGPGSELWVTAGTGVFNTTWQFNYLSNQLNMTSGHGLANVREAEGLLPKLKYANKKKSVSLPDFSLSTARKISKL